MSHAGSERSASGRSGGEAARRWQARRVRSDGQDAMGVAELAAGRRAAARLQPARESPSDGLASERGGHNTAAVEDWLEMAMSARLAKGCRSLGPANLARRRARARRPNAQRRVFNLALTWSDKGAAPDETRHLQAQTLRRAAALRGKWMVPDEARPKLNISTRHRPTSAQRSGVPARMMCTSPPQR